MNRGDVADRARGALSGFTTGQRAVVAVSVVALLLGAFALARWVTQPTWTTLFSGLSGSDASAVVDELNAEGVTYQLENGGTTVMVPQDQVYAVRVALAGKGLPADSGKDGYSVLDSQGMTATDFQQNIAYQRALEAELGSTLQAISGVNTAVVHLAIPKKDVFSTEADAPTASVLLDLAAGTTLGRDQVRAVTQLVANSVPGLSPDGVSVTDGNGTPLSVPGDLAAGAASQASETDEQTRAFEDSRSAALQSMLDQVLGPGVAVVRVSAELDYDTRDTTSETYLTDTAPPLSEATSSESYAPGAGYAGGALGQAWPSIVPDAGTVGGGTYVKIDRTVDNAVGKVVTREQSAPGTVQRMSVAVVIDSATAGTVDPATVQAMVANAVGLDTARGDTVQVSSMPFDRTAAETAAAEIAAAEQAAQTAQYVQLGIKGGIALLVAIVLGIVALRRRRRRPTVQATAADLPPEPVEEDEEEEAEKPALEAAVEALPAEPALDPSLERDLLRNEVIRYVDNAPEEMAALVTSWVSTRRS